MNRATLPVTSLLPILTSTWCHFNISAASFFAIWHLFGLLASCDIYNFSAICHLILIGLKFYHNAGIGPEWIIKSRGDLLLTFFQFLDLEILCLALCRHNMGRHGYHPCVAANDYKESNSSNGRPTLKNCWRGIESSLAMGCVETDIPIIKKVVMDGSETGIQSGGNVSEMAASPWGAHGDIREVYF